MQQWDGSQYARFSESEPWIWLPADRNGVNVSDQESDEDSILNFYRRLIRLRKEYKVISEGRIEFIFDEVEEILACSGCKQMEISWSSIIFLLKKSDFRKV